MSTLFTNVTAVTMDPEQPVLQGVYVAVQGPAISYIGPDLPQGEFDRTVDCTGKVMMPGLVDSHTHVPMTIMRGFGGGHNLQDWLNDYIFPTEAKLDSRCVRAGTDLAMAELIAGGVTCIADMYYFCDDIAQSVAQAGISANLSRSVTCFEELDDPASFQSCVEMREFVDKWHGYDDGRILVDASIHGEYTSYACPKMWEYLASYADSHGLGMQVHISETISEHEDCLKRHHDKTPLQILDKYGVWQNGGIAAHCVWISPEDRELMVKRGITAVHNPMSNLKLGSGVAPVPRMLGAGVNVAIATDGVASNNSHDMFEEMKLAAILHNVTNRELNTVTARTALKMATVNGAKAMGRNTGVLAAGKLADLILVDFTAPGLMPCHDVEENLVFSAHGSDVCMTMARGKVLYENGQFLTLDLDHIRHEVQDYALPHMFSK